ncbi:MAG: ABC transporter permease [Alphaproteobacteria bacterium]|nr:ABC transporter permease [Alphaproteobacteria bacterium]
MPDLSLILPLAARNALRNSRRTALTALTVLLGTGLLVVGLSWINGIFGQFQREAARSTGHVRVVSKAWAEREALQPLYENIPDTAPVAAAIERIPGVTGVYPRLLLGAAMAPEDGEIGDDFALMVGAPLAWHQQVMGLDERVASGRFFSEDDGARKGEALIGKALAAQLGVDAGQDVIVLGRTQDGSMSDLRLTAVGVVDTGNGLYDKQLFIDLEQARWAADIPDGALELLAYGDDYGGADALDLQIEALLADGQLAREAGLPEGGELIAQAWNHREPWVSALSLFDAIVGIVVSCIVFITALGVLNTMLMSVLERTAEIGVLRAMGMQRGEVVLAFVFEALVISVVGGLLGVTLGSLAALAMGQTGIDLGTAASNLPDTMPVNRILHPAWNLGIALRAFGLGLVMAIVGSTTPAVRATRVQPVQAMRSRR